MINKTILQKLIIRPFKPSDIEDIRLVANLAFDNAVDRYWSVRGAERAPYTYVAVVDEKVLGVIEFESYALSNSIEGHIWYIFVHPKYQRMGIGSQLLKRAEETIKKDGAIRVWALTGPENIKTQKFFEKNGYQRITIEEMKKILGSTNTKRLLRRMIYYEGDIIFMKKIN